MKTIKELKEELNKFSDDCLCYAYEGEVTGIIIIEPKSQKQGVIYCSNLNEIENKTELCI